MDLPGSIELTDDERELLREIIFPPHPLGGAGDEARRASVDPAQRLTLSLIERQAIPPVRWRYFDDADLNIGQHRSRKATFEGHGNRGAAIYRHAGFLKFLRYFVFGPDLPGETMSGYAQLIEECEPVRSGDQEAFCDFARHETRSRGLERKLAAEEFFKLSLELGLDDWTSRAVRDAVMRMRAR